LKIASLFPEFIERYYSNGLYPIISKISRTTFGFTSVSIGDIIYGIVLFLVFRWFWKVRKTWKMTWKDNLLKIASFASVFYFMFHFLWATNYHRIPMHEKLEIDKEYSTQELEAFTLKLIEKTNAIHQQITKNDSLKVVVPYTTQEIFDLSVKSYESVQKEFPFLTYEKPSIKPSLISVPLSYMGFGGYLNPFTNEAQVNNCLPKYNFPTTTLHEMAHQIGYASESEANFVGFLAAKHSEDVRVRYAAYFNMFMYAAAQLKRTDSTEIKQIVKQLHPDVITDLRFYYKHLSKYEGWLQDGSGFFYDIYLKQNRQKNGIGTYGEVTGWLVSYRKKYGQL
jgi:hypothetical protein